MNSLTAAIFSAVVLASLSAGQDCPQPPPPIPDCKPDLEILCGGSLDPRGCPFPNFCFPIQQDKNGGLCPAECPVICNPAEELPCPGRFDQATGCLTPIKCVPIATGENGVRCSPSSLCPVTCDPETEVMCPGSEIIPAGCPPSQGYCAPKTEGCSSR